MGLCLKLEVWYVYIHRYTFSENIPFRTETSLILSLSAVFCIKISIFGKNSNFSRRDSMRTALEVFPVLCLIFLRWEVTINENVKVIDHVVGVRVLDCSKSTINWQYDNGDINGQHNVLTLPCFSCQAYLMVQVSCQYLYCFWSYENFCL